MNELISLFSYPFMQRALMGGVLLGVLGGLLGSLAIVRQLSFFSHTVGHAALLGIVLSALLNWDPTLVLLPFTVVFGLAVVLLIQRTQLWSDTVLNVVFSAALAIAVLVLGAVPGYRGNLNSLLFGDILAITGRDVGLMAAVLGLSLLVVGMTLKNQLLITLHPGMAKAQGIPVQLYEMGFVVLLSLAVAVAIKAVGVLLVNAFLVIPAATSRLVSQRFDHFMLGAILVGGGSAVVGMALSGAANWASGPSIVLAQMAAFMVGLLLKGGQYYGQHRAPLRPKD